MNTTIKTKTLNPLPQLVQGSSTYKLAVPTNVEEKIRYLLRKFPSTEWSGVLFYTHEGTFENNDLVITCKDIYPMDLGNATYTEFHMSEEVASYMADNIELFDCETGILHSHHSMSSNFSGTDMQTLQTEGNDTNCFVSLIVNTKGEYSAKITRKLQTKSEVTIKSLGKSYEFFGNGSKAVSEGKAETTKVVDKEVIEYFNLTVERHEVTNALQYLDTRFEEIERKKRESLSKYSYGIDSYNNNDCLSYLRSNESIDNSQPKQLSLFKEVSEETGHNSKEYSIEDLNGVNWQPDPKKIHRAVVNMLTCNFILNPDKFDLKQWIAHHMTNIYGRIFGEDSLQSAKGEVCGAFSEWKDFIIQFTLDHFDYSDVPDPLLENYDILMYVMAQALCDELYPYINMNAYVKAYYDDLSLYI